MLSIVLYRKAKAFYKLKKILGNSCFVGYSTDGVNFSSTDIKYLKARTVFNSYQYPLNIKITDEIVLWYMF